MTHQSESAKARSPWNDERITLLKQLYADKLSCSRIAVEINNRTGSLFTRNAVIGVAHRIGLERRGKNYNRPNKSTKTRSSPRSRVPREYRRSKVKLPDLSFLQFERPDVAPLHISLALLNNKTCRWPYGDGPFTFCGCETLDGPYCFAHKMQSIGQGTQGERTASKVLERLA